MSKQARDVVVIGFALFAMFFGAGNLIFPVSLGKASGSSFWPAILGFVLTATGLPFLGILAGIKAGGSANMVSPLNRYFATCISIALMFCIGPLFAVPRTAATTYEMSVKPFTSAIHPVLFYCLYFAVNVVFVMKPSRIIDIVGSVLTPILLVTLSFLIIKGILNPVAEPVYISPTNVFSTALIEGYQTMDALAAVIFSYMILSAALRKGYRNKDEIIGLVARAGVVAVGGLGIVYGGLVYLGSQMSGVVPWNIEKVQLVVEIARRILGPRGTTVLGVCVSLACITTSIGLVATVASYFERATMGKLKYNTNVIWISIASAGISSLGVDRIVNLAVPVLRVLYPMVIVLILATLCHRFVKDDRVVAGTVYTAFAVALVDTVNLLGLRRITCHLPFADIGFAWVVPSLVVFTVITLEFVLGLEDTLRPAKR